MRYSRVTTANAHAEVISNNCSCSCVTQEKEVLMLMQTSPVITAHAHAQLLRNKFSCSCLSKE